MNRISCILLLASTLMLGSCISMEQLSIDYMLPADVSFPASLKRVAIVNNAPQTTGQHSTTDFKNKETKAATRPRPTIYNGDAKLTAEALAEALAEANYFDEVVICDSALNTTGQENQLPLTTQAVGQLTDKLDVDFLISLENIQIDARQRLGYAAEWNLFYGATDIKVYPTVCIYLPHRKGAMATINSTDSIFWEATGNTEGEVHAQLVEENEMLKQASEFAGEVPVKHLLPTWKTANRYYFYGSSVGLRDAAIYVREGNWGKAIELWKQQYENRKGKSQMYAAYNLALGYEIQDSISTALEWARKAQEVAKQIDHVGEQASSPSGRNLPNYLLTTLYVKELQEREKDIARLNVQMSRFNAAN